MNEKRKDIFKQEIFLASMNHDLRSPLNCILGMAEVLKESNLSKEQEENLRVLERSSIVLLGIVNNILEYSQLKTKKLVLNYTSLQLREVILTIQDVFEVQAKSKGLQFEVKYDEHLPPTILGDRIRLIQLFSNLLGNGIKFTESGTVGINVSLVGISDGYVETLFQVYDTGTGIDNDKLDSIFNPYTQENETIVSKHGGFGLGLSIVDSIVKTMNGKVEVESEIGKGTIVKVFIKFLISVEERDIENPKIKVESAYLDSKSFHSPYKVLLADDSIDNQLLIKAFTKDTPLILDFALDGKSAFEMFKINNYDLVVLDLQMPIMDGYECIKKIRKYEEERGREKTPSISFTANGYEAEIEKSYSSGFDNFILKPVKKEDFVNSIYKTIFSISSKKRLYKITKD